MRPKAPLSYFPWEDPAGEKNSSAETKARHKENELWLAVYLPKLALEAVTQNKSLKSYVLVEEVKGKQFIHTASDLAEDSGVVAGMPLNAAYLLCPDLEIEDINEFAQQQRLQQLASWALQYSPRVSLEPPCSFILEIRGSIQYFGSLEIIREKIADALKNKWQHGYHLAISPTPAASLLLARAPGQITVNNIPDLRSALGDLSINLLPLDEKRRRQLGKIGVRILRDLWRLPRAELSRRLGVDLITYLDQVLGNLSSPLINYQAPPRFEIIYDIGCEVDNYQLLLPVTDKLLNNLSDFLRKNDVYTSSFIFYFQHQQHIPTSIKIDLRQKLRDPKHFKMLLETKTSQMTLPASVFSIKLVAETLRVYNTQTSDLFPSYDYTAGIDTNIEHLLEQLYVRLGYDVVTGIATHEDHRPEFAYKNSQPGFRKHAEITKPRPFWLLPSPTRLFKKNNQLYYKSLIRFSMGPERIEAGWWDCSDICRDYYIGIDEIAGSLWLYHDLKDRQKWYLHGLFG
jgi:protein ImuB